MENVITFGAFADPHYADRDVRIGRWYREAPNRIAAAQERFAAAQTDFNVCLGDFIDLCDDDRDLTPALEQITALIGTAGRPTYYVPGNHDLAAVDRAALAAFCGWPDNRGYYAFVFRGIRFIVLNTNYDGESETLPPWDETWINSDQLRWLETELQNPEPAVIFTHANLDPRMRDGHIDQHIVMNAADARAIIEASGKVKLVVQGHCHGGAFTALAGIDYVTLPAMVMGENGNSAMIFSIAADGSYTCRQLFEQA